MGNAVAAAKASDYGCETTTRRRDELQLQRRRRRLRSSGRQISGNVRRNGRLGGAAGET